MAGYDGQGYGQDFYESGYDMEEVQRSNMVEVPRHQTGWQQQQQAPAPAQSQWAGAAEQQQAYYHPAGSYDPQQSYGQQGGPAYLYTN